MTIKHLSSPYWNVHGIKTKLTVAGWTNITHPFLLLIVTAAIFFLLSDRRISGDPNWNWNFSFDCGMLMSRPWPQGNQQCLPSQVSFLILTILIWFSSTGEQKVTRIKNEALISSLLGQGQVLLFLCAVRDYPSLSFSVPLSNCWLVLCSWLLNWHHILKCGAKTWCSFQAQLLLILVFNPGST